MLENWSSEFPTRSDTNRAVQPQEMARGLKFWIYEEEGLYYLCSENRGADQLRTAKLICVFVFAYAKKFSHDTARFTLPCNIDVLSARPHFVWRIIVHIAHIVKTDWAVLY